MPHEARLKIYLHNELTTLGEVNETGAVPSEILTPLRDEMLALITTQSIGTPILAHFIPLNLMYPESANGVRAVEDIVCASTIILLVEDAELAIARLTEQTRDTTFDGALEFIVEPIGEVIEPGTADAPPAYKSIEVYYDVASIPSGYDNPLDFRNAAMELIETALEDADVGEWVGVDSGMAEVNFGFAVSDFDQAEQIVRMAVAGTPFSGIREMTRYDSTQSAA